MRQRLYGVACALLSTCVALGFPLHPLTVRALSAVAPLAAVALKGDIYALQADNTLQALTHYGLNSAPVLSPRGLLVAYLSTSTRFVDANGSSSAQSVWVVPSDGRSNGADAYRLTPTTANVRRGGVAWSSDGQQLAFFENDSVVVCDYRGHNRRVVLRNVGGAFFSGGPTIAWAPDSRRLAVALYSDADTGTAPQSLTFAIAHTDHSGKSTLVTVRFASGALGSSLPPRGSHPTANGVVWTRDGTHLIVQTLITGEGVELSGVWSVASSGGIAQQIVGTARDAQGRNTPTGPLAQATHAILSSDARQLALDPQAHLWVTTVGATSGRYLDTGLVPSGLNGCSLVQDIWLRDGSGLAYVATCVEQRQSEGHIRSRLYTVTLATDKPHLVKTVDDPHQNALQIAPAYRCVLCGA